MVAMAAQGAQVALVCAYPKTEWAIESHAQNSAEGTASQPHRGAPKEGLSAYCRNVKIPDII